MALSTAKYPNMWKIAKVIALHKKGSHSDPGNYRPISLLDTFGKIFERLIYEQMISFIKQHSILFIYQYGFRSGMSTTLALIDIIDKIKTNIDNNKFGLGIFIDIRKAFDTVNHSILLEKLEYYGFRGHSLILLKSYLTDRKQYSHINGCNSTQMSISCGVPQGSVLGPLLFLLYINDIQYSTNQDNIKLFADDTGIFLFDKNLNTLLNLASDTASNVSEWYTCNRLALSIEKSNFIIFHGKNKRVPPEIVRLKFGEQSIKRVKSTKYIGATIDEKLNWEEHVNQLIKSLHRYFGIFYNLRNFVNKDLIRVMYFSSIYSRVSYGIEVYGTCKATLFNKLQVTVNKLLRVLNRKDRQYSSTLLHSELDILKIKYIRDSNILKFVYNCVKGTPSQPFQNYFVPSPGTLSLNTRQIEQLDRNTIRTEIGRSTTHFTGATLWNQLQPNIKMQTSAKSFKTSLQEYLKQSQLNEN